MEQQPREPLSDADSPVSREQPPRLARRITINLPSVSDMDDSNNDPHYRAFDDKEGSDDT